MEKLSFKIRVVDIVKGIPKGKTMSYKEVAVKAGNPKAARAVGVIMRSNKDVSIPCHRVIRSDGQLGGYNGLKGDKSTILYTEKMV